MLEVEEISTSAELTVEQCRFDHKSMDVVAPKIVKVISKLQEPKFVKVFLGSQKYLGNSQNS
jgi:hypothetical protein